MLLRGLLLTVTLLLLALPSQAQTRRVALVVGNSAYQHAGALQNAVSDADAVANTLRRLGFTVTLERDQSAVAMRRTLRDFSDAARGADVALFFYAGHGLQMGQRDRAENFLVPIDARLTDARDLEDEAISLSRILQLMDGAKARIVILDACRDNPLLARMTQAGGTRGVSRGLAPIEASGAQGTLVAFSTAPGTVAADGTGRNSPFTTALLKHLPTPGLEIRSALTRVRAEVADATRNAQVPWSNDGLLHELFLAGEAAAPATTSQQAALAPPTLAPTEVAIELAFWQSIQNSRNSADFEDYLRRYPTGNFAGLARNRIAAMRETTEATAPALPSVPPPAHECDRLAQLPRSSMASVPAFAEGVEFSRIDVPLARRACQVARTAYPTEPRFMALAGRVEHAARNYAEALRLYRLAADQGYPIAQSNLGAMYANGQGVRRDDAEAVRLYRLAADQGYSTAQNNLGWMYANGRGVRRDDAEAVRLYRLAADQGDAAAQANLGGMYADGQGVRRDDAEAVRLFRLAADQGYATAQINLGWAYANGRGVRRDDAEAVRFYRLAADQGNATAQINLGWVYANGRGIQRDDAEAARLYRLAADQGNATAQAGLGQMYESGRGVRRDDAEAARLYRLAADQGNAAAQINLGGMYEDGRGVRRDDAEAARLYRLAADQGHAGAQTNLGLMYRNGRGVRRDDAEAVRLYRLAADQGNATAQNNLGRMYANGWGVRRDDAEAVRLYRLAVDQGDAAAQTNLGGMYEGGRGVRRDDAEAVRLYRLAVDQGNAAAQTNLGWMYENGRGVPRDRSEAIRLYRLAAAQENQLAISHLRRLGVSR